MSSTRVKVSLAIPSEEKEAVRAKIINQLNSNDSLPEYTVRTSYDRNPDKISGTAKMEIVFHDQGSHIRNEELREAVQQQLVAAQMGDYLQAGHLAAKA